MQPTNHSTSRSASHSVSHPVNHAANVSRPIHDDVLASSIPAAVEAEIDDLIARAETFIGDEDGQDSRNGLDAELFQKTAPKYMHGVVRGQQAYLTTNLLETGSLMLLQPQMVWTLGRNREAGIPVRDRMLSRRHASIMYLREDRAFYLLDLNSMNGSYVNGVRVDQQRLKDGDFVRIGNTEFFFFISEHYENLEPLHADVHAKLLSALLRENTIIE
jgi:FHA domain